MKHWACVLCNWTNASPVELDQFWRFQTRTFQLGKTIQTFTRFLHDFVNVVVSLEVTRQGEAQHFGFWYDINVFTINNNRVERGGFGGEANAELFAFGLIKFKFVHDCTG